MMQVQEIIKSAKKIRGLKQQRKIRYLLSQFPHPSISPNNEELARWSAWPQQWSKPSSVFLLLEEEQKQLPQMILHVW
jgi:hypothetical protein